MTKVILSMIEEVSDELNEHEQYTTAKHQLQNKLIKICKHKKITKRCMGIVELVNRMQCEIQKEQKPEPTWKDKVTERAKEFIKENLIDEMIEALMNYTELENVFHNNRQHNNTFYKVQDEINIGQMEALELIQELYKFEETDTGQWDRLSLDAMLNEKAAYTYSNAVYFEIENLLEEIEANINTKEIQDEIKQKIILKKKEYYVEFNEDNEFNEQMKTKLKELIMKELK
jgi:hypothetical protein